MEQLDPAQRPSLTIAYSLQADVAPPVISAVTATAITTSGAAIRWTTNEPSDSQVEYGATTAYGTLTTLNRLRVASHTVTLTGLAAGNLYHFRVRSRDFAGNLAVSRLYPHDSGRPASCRLHHGAGEQRDGHGTVTMTANASDDVGVAGVQFRWMAQTWARKAPRRPTPCLELYDATNGSHTLTAVARDVAGITTSAGIRSWWRMT
jgi:hypothetical protein